MSSVPDSQKMFNPVVGSDIANTFAKPLTVLWAFDPYATEDLALQDKVAQAIAHLSPRNARIFPIFALERKGMNWSGDYNEANWAETETPAALDAIDAVLARVSDQFTFQTEDIRPTVLGIDEASHAAAVHKLVRFAKQVHADMIALGSHGTSNLMQLLKGSFVEAFLAESELLLLIVNENVQSVEKPCESIVFATDFSPPCWQAFEAILPVARSMGAELHLFYKIPNRVDPLVQSGVYMFGGGWVSVDTFIDEHQAARDKEGALWIEMARALGVEAHWVAGSDDGPMHTTIADSVVAYAKTLSNPMIATASQSGAFSTLLFGSTTKDMIRGAACPVFVVPYRP